MAIYRFRISFEDFDEVVREIDIKSNQTFKDLHEFFLKNVGYDPEKSSSFYVSNDQWIKNEELAYLPNPRKVNNAIALMENSKFSKFIDDPHQKFYYIYNFEKPYEFHVELIKILENNPELTLPSLFKTVGEAPKIVLPNFTPEDLVGDEEDFIDDSEVEIADQDELEGLNTDTEGEDKEEEDDDFADEFSDNEGFDEDDVEK
jgi:hypothetical protein